MGIDFQYTDKYWGRIAKDHGNIICKTIYLYSKNRSNAGDIFQLKGVEF